jgi:chromosome segregation ATPase
MQASLQRLEGQLEEARATASGEAASAAMAGQRLLAARRELERETRARVSAEEHLKRALAELRRRAARANEMLSHARAEAEHEQRRVEIAQRELDEVRTQLARERGDRASLELHGDGLSSPDTAPEPPLGNLQPNVAQADAAENEEIGNGDLDSVSADAVRVRKPGIFRRNASRRTGA